MDLKTAAGGAVMAMPDMAGQAGSNLIAGAAIVISAAVAIYVYVRTEGRERRVEKASAYLNLEVHSSDLFRYQADNADLLLPLRCEDRPADAPAEGSQARETALNYYFQCLNLFEVCSNFRRNKVIEKQVFASWIAWFHDILKDWYFREIWAAELRSNYTEEVRNIFDAGVAIFEQHSDPRIRLRDFYKAVSHVMGGCSVIENWLDDTATPFAWPVVPRRGLAWPSIKSDRRPSSDAGAKPSRASLDVTLTWNGPDDALTAAALAGRVVSQSADYISHGEIQTGLSDDGKTWAPNLADLYAADFADLQGRDLLVAKDENGRLVAFAVVAWEGTPRRRFAVLEDMAVDPDVRSGGVGARMVEAIAEHVRARGTEWLFLESGVRNTRAHQFYERHGFTELSHVFGRRLIP